MFYENRLIGVTQRELDARSKAAGQTPISTAKPTSVSTQTGRMSAAEANANLQNIQRANTLSTKPGEVKSYIDPNTGLETRQRDATGNFIPGTGTLSTQNTLGVQFQNTNSGVNAAMGLAEQGGQTAGYTSPYNTPSASSLGQIDQSAYNRLIEAGRTPQQALAEIQGNRPDVQAAFNQVGTGLRPQTLEQRQQEAAAGAAQRLRDMGVGDPNLINQAASQAAQEVLNQDTAQIQNQTALSEQQRQQAAATAASGAAANKAATAQTSGISPEIEAALAGLPPIEAGLIRAQLQAGATEAAAGQNAALQNFADETKAADASLNAYDKVLDKAEADSKQLYEASRGIVEDSEERQKENLAREQQNALEQLAWAEQKATRDGKIALRKQMDSMTAAQALSGGYGSSNWNAELEQAEFDGERAIADAQQQFAFKRADVAIAYTNSLNTIYDNAAVRKLEALKAYKSDLATNNQYRFSATEKTEERKVKAKQDLNNSLATIAKEQAAGIRTAIGDVRAAQKAQKAEEQSKEDRALDRIEYLLDNYPRESVQGALKDLAKDVTSFNVQEMLNTDSLEEIKRKRTATKSSGGGGVSSYLPSSLQSTPEPELSFEDFTKQKLSDLEAESKSSFSTAERLKRMEENEAAWKTQYDAIYVSPLRSEKLQSSETEIQSSFGDSVLTAAKQVLDGTYTGTNPIKSAAKSLGVPESQVAIAVSKLRQDGFVADTSILSTDQQKRWDKVRGELEGDTFYKVWNGAKSAITRVDRATAARTNLGDIAAINAFQNGIVDPGATVREGDVSLIQGAISWSEAADLNYWKQRLLSDEGAVMPDSMRIKMRQLASSIAQGYEQDVLVQTVPKYKTLLRQNGLPQNVIDDYLGETAPEMQGKVSVSPQVSSFVSDFLNK